VIFLRIAHSGGNSFSLNLKNRNFKAKDNKISVSNTVLVQKWQPNKNFFIKEKVSNSWLCIRKKKLKFS
jgi:hypothetical protein